MLYWWRTPEVAPRHKVMEFRKAEKSVFKMLYPQGHLKVILDRRYSTTREIHAHMWILHKCEFDKGR